MLPSTHPSDRTPEEVDLLVSQLRVAKEAEALFTSSLNGASPTDLDPPVVAAWNQLHDAISALEAHLRILGVDYTLPPPPTTYTAADLKAMSQQTIDSIRGLW